jgi:hypothetical protein
MFGWKQARSENSHVSLDDILEAEGSMSKSDMLKEKLLADVEEGLR